MISRFRPTCPILAMTPSVETSRRLTMAWGIKPLLMDTHGATEEIVWHAVEQAARLELIKPGDLVGVLVGAPHESDPTTDVLRLGGDSPAAGRSLREIDLRRKTGATLLAVVRGGTSYPNPAPDFKLEPGDDLVLMGGHQQLESAFDELEPRTAVS